MARADSAAFFVRKPDFRCWRRLPVRGSLAHGESLIHDQAQLWIAPDVVLIQDWANKACLHGIEDYWKLTRPDGRVVLLFPEGGTA